MDRRVQLLHRVHPNALRGAVEKVPLLTVQHQDAVTVLGGGLFLRDGEKDLPVDEGGVAHLRFGLNQGHIGPVCLVQPQLDVHRPDPAQHSQGNIIRFPAGGQLHLPLAQHQHGLHHDGFGQGAFPQMVEQAVCPAAAEIRLLRRQKAGAAGDVFQVGTIPGKVAHDVIVHRLGGFGQLAVLSVHQKLLALGEHAGHGQQPQQDNSQGQHGEDGKTPRAGERSFHSGPLCLSFGDGCPAARRGLRRGRPVCYNLAHENLPVKGGTLCRTRF